MDRSELLKRAAAITTLSEMLGKTFSASAVSAFVQATGDIPIDKFQSGIEKSTKECRFMPSPAEFRELAVGRPLMPSAAEVCAAHKKRWGEVV